MTASERITIKVGGLETIEIEAWAGLGGAWTYNVFEGADRTWPNCISKGGEYMNRELALGAALKFVGHRFAKLGGERQW